MHSDDDLQSGGKEEGEAVCGGGWPPSGRRGAGAPDRMSDWGRGFWGRGLTSAVDALTAAGPSCIVFSPALRLVRRWPCWSPAPCLPGRGLPGARDMRHGPTLDHGQTARQQVDDPDSRRSSREPHLEHLRGGNGGGRGDRAGRGGAQGALRRAGGADPAQHSVQ
jgi:hypothetical protein